MSKAKKTYYKVVGHDLKSFILYRASANCILTYDQASKFAVQYKENEWVYGNNLFVFDSLNSAKNFTRHLRLYIYIYECEALKPRKADRIVTWYQTETIAKILDLIKKKKKYTHLLNDMAPEGSMVCSGVKLLKKVI